MSEPFDTSTLDYVAPVYKQRIILAFKRGSPFDTCPNKVSYTIARMQYVHVEIILPTMCRQKPTTKELAENRKPMSLRELALSDAVHADDDVFIKTVESTAYKKKIAQLRCPDCQKLAHGYVTSTDPGRRDDRRQCFFDAAESNVHHRSFLAHAVHGVTLVVDKPYDEYYDFYELHVSNRQMVEEFCDKQIEKKASYRISCCQEVTMCCTAWYDCRQCQCLCLCFEQRQNAGYFHPKAGAYKKLATDDEDQEEGEQTADEDEENKQQKWFCSEFVVAALHKTGEFNELMLQISPDYLFYQIAVRFPAEMRRVHSSVRRKTSVTQPIAMRVVIEKPSTPSPTPPPPPPPAYSETTKTNPPPPSRQTMQTISISMYDMQMQSPRKRYK
jgi:hypothetical protein